MRLGLGLGLTRGEVVGVSAYLAARGWAGSSAGADFAAGRYWVDDAWVSEAQWFAAYSASSTSERAYIGADGRMRADLAANAPRWTWLGNRRHLLIERALTNKCTAQKVGITGTTGITKSGDAAATLGIADVSAVLSAAGLLEFSQNGYAYVLDNTLGTTNADYAFAGASGNTNVHSSGALIWGTGGVRFGQSGSFVPEFRAPETPTWCWQENAAITQTSRTFFVRVPAGAKAWVLAPHFVEAANAPVMPIASSASGSLTRAAEDMRLPPAAETLMQGTAGTVLLIANGARSGAASEVMLGFAGSDAGIVAADYPTIRANKTANLDATMGSRAVNGPWSAALAWDGTGRSLCALGGTVATDTNGIGDRSEVYLGRDGTGNRGDLMVEAIVLWTARKSDSEIQALTAPIVRGWAVELAMWGDSVTQDTARKMDGLASPIAHTFNFGVSGDTSTQIKDRCIAASDYNQSRPTTLWLGHNDSGTAFASVAANIATCAAALPSGAFIVIGMLPSASWGGATLAAAQAVNAGSATTYGTYYLDVLPALQAANDGSANDLADIAAGLTPRSLRIDGLHLTAAGYMIAAQAIRAKLVALGLYDTWPLAA